MTKTREGAAVVDFPARPAGLLRQLDGRSDVIVREIPLDAIERDPEQPRVHFDQMQLEELADSLRRDGLLQEPAVYPIAVDEDQRPSRYRLLFGERRWRAAALAGWTALRCKVVPTSRDEDLIARLRRVDQQDAENRARAALSAVEEAKGLRVKLDVMRQLEPNATKKDLVEKLAAERKVSATIIWRLLDLLDAPAVLQTAIIERRIASRDVAFQLAVHWGVLLKEHEGRVKAKREVLFRDGIRAWAETRGLPLDADTVTKFAAEQHLDPRQVRADVKTAEKITNKAEEDFATVVSRAVREAWTVKDARRILSAGRGSRKATLDTALYEHSTADSRERLTVYSQRLTDPATATPEALDELLAVLRGLLERVERARAGQVANG